MANCAPVEDGIVSQPAPPPTYTQREDPFIPTRNRYEVLKKLAQDIYLVRRRSDDELFLGAETRPSQYRAAKGLHRNGSLSAAAQVLNHENLISMVGLGGSEFFSGSTAEDKDVQELIIWDFMDAGNLAALLDTEDAEPTTRGDRSGEGLPESLVWHVGLSVLCALAWLHEGKRDKWTVSMIPQWGTVKLEPAPQELDWLPILHRRISSRSIFFQKPKGIETYGACKLGDFSAAAVTGCSIAIAAGQPFLESQDEVRIMESDRAQKSSGQPVALRPGPEPEEPPFQAVVDTWKFRKAGDKRETGLDRPSNCSDDLFDLGTVLYHMMTQRDGPPQDLCASCECRPQHSPPPNPCPHKNCDTGYLLLERGLRALPGYTDGVKVLVLELIRQHVSNGPEVTAAQLLHRFRNGEYQLWKRGTPEGLAYRDFLDDMRWRWENQQARTGEWMEEVEGEEEAEMEGPGEEEEEDVGMELGEDEEIDAAEFAGEAQLGSYGVFEV